MSVDGTPPFSLYTSPDSLLLSTIKILQYQSVVMVFGIFTLQLCFAN